MKSTIEMCNKYFNTPVAGGSTQYLIIKRKKVKETLFQIDYSRLTVIQIS